MRNAALAIFMAASAVYCNHASGLNNTSREDVFVHFDKDIYIAGDEVHYKAYLVNKSNARQNNILYFSLYGINKQNELHWRTNVVNNMANGFFRLSPDLPDGIYEIRAYTNAMRCDGAEKSFTWRILIIGFTESTTDSLFIPVIKSHQSFSPGSESQGIEIKAMSEHIVPGKDMHVSISRNAEDSAFLSFSVSLETPFSDVLQNQDMISHFEKSRAVPTQDTWSCRQESKGYILAGTLLQRSNRMPVSSAKIVLAVVDSTLPSLLYSKTDTEGDFYFFLNKYFDNRDLILQLTDNKYAGDLIWIIEDKALNAPPDIRFFKLEEQQKQFLKSLRDLRMIESIFRNRPDTIIGNVVYAHDNSFFNKPNQVIHPSEYVNMLNFNEIDDNLLPSIRFNSRDNKQHISVYNDFENWMYEDVLIMLNGVPFTDLEYLGMLGTKQIKRLEIYTSGLIIGGLFYNGVVSVYTYENAIPETYLQSKAFAWHNKVISNGGPIIPDKRDNGDRLPDFRDNLSFMPDLKIGRNETINIEFPVSFLEGTYRITLNGISESGDPISLNRRFVIQQGNE